MARKKPEEVESSEDSSSSSSSSETSEEENNAVRGGDGAGGIPAKPVVNAVPESAAAQGHGNAQAAFDPMQQFLGIPAQQSQAGGSHAAGAAPQMRPQAADNTHAQRVGAVKAGMQQGAAGGYAQHHQGGMDGVYQAQARMRMQQQQQQQMAYQSMNPAAAYQSQMPNAAYNTGYNNMAIVAVDPNMQYNGNMNGMMGGGMMGGGTMGGGALVPYQNQQASLIPAMEAEKVAQQPNDYRVRRGTKPTRVNASDKAFGPLLDQYMKR
mmetsp:Transcript_9587/g.28988  ORF Transcript_9587/g.28988 Transcript_9587/m.28988 type:complete len:266 (+) Transcript_9587:1385-2182(+)